MRRARGPRRTGWVLVAAILLAGCDLGPSGPSRVLGTVTGNPGLGAAVVEVTWQGVTDFEGRGSTRVYAARIPGTTDKYRVILVDPVGGDLRFTVVLEERRLDGPALAVVSAAGTNNLDLPVGGLRVVLER